MVYSINFERSVFKMWNTGLLEFAWFVNVCFEIIYTSFRCFGTPIHEIVKTIAINSPLAYFYIIIFKLHKMQRAKQIHHPAIIQSHDSQHIPNFQSLKHRGVHFSYLLTQSTCIPITQRTTCSIPRSGIIVLWKRMHERRSGGKKNGTAAPMKSARSKHGYVKTADRASQRW